MSTADGRKIAILGLGYVGLPVAVAFAERFDSVVGFDINRDRIESLRQGHDSTGEVDAARLAACGATFTADPDKLRGCDFFIVTVPTPIDENKRPDLRALEAASRTVGRVMQRGAVVVYESTVYPGLTESYCGPILAEASSLAAGTDFTLGYSPERINPGDKEHRLESITKVVAAQDEPTLEIVAAAYGKVVTAGVHRAPSIMVAEAAKVIENTQRDLNIALMNELAMIFDRLGIDTHDVLAAARTKWNFLPFSPGLVGGHCIGVDPYYLTTRAEQVGIHPEVILAGRRINDGMGSFVAQRTLKLLIKAGLGITNARVCIVGATFKENVPDTRNSRVPSIVEELTAYGMEVVIADPVADSARVGEELEIPVVGVDRATQYDAVILAVPHDGVAAALERDVAGSRCRVLVDVRGAVRRENLPEQVLYWRL